MNSAMPIVRKELKSYFNSPIAYIVTFFFILISAIWFFFFQQFFVQNNASLRPLFDVMPWVFCVVVPALTMRSWAEERKMGTVEILATMPFSEWALVMGKFLAAFILTLIMVALTLPIPLMANLFGRFDFGQVFTQYLGVVLMAGAMVAIGSYISSLTKNQISAFIFTFLAPLILYILGQVPAWIPMPNALASIIRWISISNHFDSFSKGLLDTRDILYFVLMAWLFLFLTAKTIVFRKWR